MIRVNSICSPRLDRGEGGENEVLDRWNTSFDSAYVVLPRVSLLPLTACRGRIVGGDVTLAAALVSLMQLPTDLQSSWTRLRL